MASEWRSGPKPALLLVLWTLGSAWAQPNGQAVAEVPVQDHAAKVELKTRDYAGSVKEIDQLSATARAKGDRPAQAALALEKARTVQAWAAVDPHQSAHYDEAIAAYRVAASTGDERQRADAQNNLGVLLLKKGDPKQAVDALAQAVKSGADPKKQGYYAFNYGSALEQSGQKQEASEQYIAAVKARPELTVAAASAFRVLAAQSPSDHGRMVIVADSLIAGRQLTTARAQLTSAIGATAARSAEVLLVPLVNCYAALETTSEDFQSADLPGLERWARAANAPEAVAGLERAFVGPLPPLASRWEAPGRFPYWSAEPRRAAMSRLLKAQGDQRARGGADLRAVALYQHAWGLDAENGDAVVYLAALLRSRAKVVDPNGRLLRSLTNDLFEAKGAAYSTNDLPTAVRLHTLLGTIFEQQKRWGPTSRPDTALFQWDHAIAAAKKLAVQRPSLPPFSNLYAHLALAQVETGAGELAGQNYLQAAKGFLDQGNPPEARGAMRALDRTSSTARQSTLAVELRKKLGPY